MIPRLSGLLADFGCQLSVTKGVISQLVVKILTNSQQSVKLWPILLLASRLHNVFTVAVGQRLGMRARWFCFKSQVASSHLGIASWLKRVGERGRPGSFVTQTCHRTVSKMRKRVLPCLFWGLSPATLKAVVGSYHQATSFPGPLFLPSSGARERPFLSRSRGREEQRPWERGWSSSSMRSPTTPSFTLTPSLQRVKSNIN